MTRVHRSRHRFPRRQRGVAMLVAVLLVALGTILAATIAYESAMSARRGTATFAFDEAILVGQGAEALAAYGLRAVVQGMSTSSGSNSSNGTNSTATGTSTNNNTTRSNPGTTGTTGGTPGTADIYAAQPWAQPVGPLEVVPGVTLEAQLEDMQGRFNINWLVATTGPNAGKPDPNAVNAFNHLCELVGVEPKWADMIVDWIDTGTDPLPDGAEDSAYLGQNPPYLTANQYVTSASEILALPGFGHDRYAKLAPYITALPPGTALNVCTAPGVVLDAFLPNGRQEWSTDPTVAAYQASFDAKSPAAGVNASVQFSSTSQYFRLSSLITIGSAEFNLYSLLYMDQNGPLIHPIQRTFSDD